jgi:putative pyruvate formate lyase activating enzyme
MHQAPSYLALAQSGELARRVEQLNRLLASCTVCPHACGNNRLDNEIARCYTGRLPIVSSYTAHFGEEPLLVGTRGVGNIFFGNCNLRCAYCQNHQISQNHRVERQHEVTIERLAQIMLELQDRGCHSIGVVSPSHVVPQIVEALEIAARDGLRLPLIYNTNAFDSVNVLRLLDGIVDIYLPDLKYAEADLAYEYSSVSEYPRVAREAILEMHRQVGGTLTLGPDGLVRRGLIIRHLVLPNDIAGSKASLAWVRDALGSDVTISLMAQYFPTHRAASMPLLSRTIRQGEYERVLEYLDTLGMDNGWAQEFASHEYYRPEFERRDAPFTGGADNDSALCIHEPHPARNESSGI